MPSDAEPDPAANSCQTDLARQLVDCLGRESAIHACKMNGWVGVLNILLAEQPNGQKPVNGHKS